MKRSTPSSSAMPSMGITFVEDSVLASTMNPEPVTPAAPFDVIIRTARMANCCDNARSLPYTCARKIVAIVR